MEYSENGEYGGRKVMEGGELEKHNNADLKKIIASHALFEVVIESHINCLKATSEKAGGFDIKIDAWKKLVNSKSKATTSLNTSELDHFMEAYCRALSKLKAAMKEPTKDAEAFLNATYAELKELSEENNP